MMRSVCGFPRLAFGLAAIGLLSGLWNPDPASIRSAAKHRSAGAITRVVGFFVSGMGVALIFDGVIEALQTYGVTTALCVNPTK